MYQPVEVTLLHAVNGFSLIEYGTLIFQNHAKDSGLSCSVWFVCAILSVCRDTQTAHLSSAFAKQGAGMALLLISRRARVVVNVSLFKHKF